MVTRRLLAVPALVALLAVSACGGDDGKDSKPAWVGSSQAAPSQAPTAAGPLSLKLTPDDGESGVPISAEIGLTVAGGEVQSVALKGPDGKAVEGELRADGTSWVPAKPLKAKVKYAATVTAADPAGQVTTEKTSFTTMGTPGKRTGTGLYLFDDHTYGKAMPVVAEFSPGVKEKDRAAVQKRMFVETTPPQPGTWSWTENGSQAYYRAPDYWQTGTKLTVRLGLDGTPTGGGRYGDRDRSATATIGRDFEMKVDNKTKTMTVFENGQEIKKMPVSLGKKATPSSSGTMVVMEKMAATVFDTTDTDGADGYVTDIEYAQRLTWSGQYIHSAPWSVGDQGERNVSHGCVNLSPKNAAWLFERTMIGDPVSVAGTEDKLSYGNGWTPWDVSWEKFAEGSALPVPAELG